MKTNTHFDHISLREMFQTKAEEEIKTHFVFNNFFLPENHAVYEKNVEKYSRSGQATHGNTAHAYCILDAQV